MRCAIVCGGRDFQPEPCHAAILLDLLRHLKISEVVHGAARGADSWARSIADANGYETRAFAANWSLGRAAGPMRNGAMAEYVLGNGGGYCIAFPGGAGTADMLRNASGRGLAIIDLRQMRPSSQGGE